MTYNIWTAGGFHSSLISVGFINQLYDCVDVSHLMCCLYEMKNVGVILHDPLFS